MDNLEQRKREMVQKYLDDEIDTAEFVAFNQTYMVKGREQYVPLLKHSDDGELVEKAAAGDPEAYETVRQLEQAERAAEIRKAEVEYTQILKEFNYKVKNQVQKGLDQNAAEVLIWERNPSLYNDFQRISRILNRS